MSQCRNDASFFLVAAADAYSACVSRFGAGGFGGSSCNKAMSLCRDCFSLYCIVTVSASFHYISVFGACIGVACLHQMTVSGYFCITYGTVYGMCTASFAFIPVMAAVVMVCGNRFLLHISAVPAGVPQLSVLCAGGLCHCFHCITGAFRMLCRNQFYCGLSAFGAGSFQFANSNTAGSFCYCAAVIGVFALAFPNCCFHCIAQFQTDCCHDIVFVHAAVPCAGIEVVQGQIVYCICGYFRYECLCCFASFVFFQHGQHLVFLDTVTHLFHSHCSYVVYCI
ncbi:hypothetical protein IMSAG013_00925 [Clostridiales bacterium]|nr:hypothetical protein IMSAG013_00925 [Clostridiales bacterium]